MRKIRFFEQRWFHQVLILAVLLATAWLRFWRLAQIPPGFFADEAHDAMDALWMLTTRSPQIFFPGNTGREPMWYYLGALFFAILKPNPYTFRLLAALVGILTISLVYRWLMALFATEPDRRWLSLLAMTGLAFSFWHVLISRTGYRAILVVPFVIFTAYLFWRGRQKKSWPYFIGAGVTLGLSQYTYVSARLLPFVFILFIVVETLLAVKEGQSPATQWISWGGLLLTGLVSLLVFLPLGLYFLNNPNLFSVRAEQVSILNRIARGETTWGNHLLTALSIFAGGYNQDWRHSVVGHSGFDVVTILGFWLGLIVAGRRFKAPHHLFLFSGLLVLWLPAFLSADPTHPLRLAAMLPFYYALSAVGLVYIANIATRLVPLKIGVVQLKIIIFAIVFVLGGSRTAFLYFNRWANEPMVYWRYDGPLVDLTNYLLNASLDRDIILPFEMYSHPAARFILGNEFKETDRLPNQDFRRPVIVVKVPDYAALMSETGQIKQQRLHTYVWLTQDSSGDGVSLVSRPANLDNLPVAQRITPFLNPYTGELVALLTSSDAVESILQPFTDLNSFYKTAENSAEMMMGFGRNTQIM